MSTCRSCDAPVIFVPSATTGKPMILDAAPGKGVILTDRTGSLHGMVTLYDDPAHSEARVVAVYTDHHVTCPKAAEWKGRTRSQGPRPDAPDDHVCPRCGSRTDDPIDPTRAQVDA